MMVGIRVAFTVVLGVAVVACATPPAASPMRLAVATGSPQITNPDDGPSPDTSTPAPTPVPDGTNAGTCVAPPTDIDILIDMVGAGSKHPGGDPVACFSDVPVTFDAIWLGGGDADCPTAPEPAWLACSSFSLRAPGDTRKVGPPEMIIAIHPSADLSIPSGPYARVRITGHFDDPAAQTCHETQLGDTETPAPAGDAIERCRSVFVVTRAVAAQPSPTAAGTTSTPEPGAFAVPDAPSGASFKITYPTATKNRLTVTWKEPRAKGVEIRVYGVTTCIAMPPSPDENAQGPCLVEHTPLPASVRKLLARTSASTGKVSWTWSNWENIGSSVAMSPDGTYYEAIVVAAYSDTGHSKFVIVDPGYWCGGCTY